MLCADRLTKYYGGLAAVRDLSFTVSPGQVLGYLGPNGSGKSTTIKLLTGLLEPTSGRILFNGVSIRDCLLEYRQVLGYVPEEPHVYAYLTGPEFLTLVGRLRGVPRRTLETRIEELLELWGLTDARYATLGSYSKGMRQKILISAALLHDPDIIVLDEPNSGLDVTSSLILRSLVQELAAAGKMIIYSSHVLEIVERVATEVLILHDSRVVAHDSVTRLRELMALPSLEDVFKKVVIASDVNQVARDIVGVMRL
jgi:ABC-2 type transport system ATP-binding protein